MKGEWYAIIGLGLMTLALIPLGYSVLSRIARRHNNDINNATPTELFEAFGLFFLAVGLLLFLCWQLGYGQFWIFEVPIKLAVGWIAYLDRIERRVEPDAMHVVSAVVCLAATAVGAHLVLRWGAASAGHLWSLKRTFQVLLLVALMFASGLAVAGVVQQTTWLIRTPEPLVKDNRIIS